MKTRIIVAVMFVFSTLALCQTDYFTTFRGHKVGGYLGTAGRVSSVFSDNAGYADLKGALVFDGKWAIGFTGSGLYYDKSLNRLVSDGTYHLQVAFGGLFVERIFSVNDNFKVSASLMTGQGEALYQYDRDYRKEKVWSEEIIDKTTFGVQELGIEIQHRIKGNFWLGLTGGYRNTSPLELIDTPDDLLEKWNAGVSFKYGIF
ncbi:hypothetical protein GF406_06525 [candidate division KSB1 bacterium]|nr:hypothetical protein [candidate division KSB1 bacterium]